MTYRVFVYISVVTACLVNTVILSHLFFSRPSKSQKIIDFVPAKHSAFCIVPSSNGGGSVDYIHISGDKGGDGLPPYLWPVTEDIAVLDAGGGGQGGVGGKAFVLLPVNE